MKGIITLAPQKAMPQGREVWIIRHGQTKLNTEDRIRGWADIPLDEVGVTQAQELGEAFREEGVELDGIYASDLYRSVETAIEVSKMTGIPLLGTSKSLRPWNVGDYTGYPGKEAHKIMSHYAKNKPGEDIPNGESFDCFKFRFLVGIIGFLNSNRGKKLGFVSHSRGERILHGWVAEGCPESLAIDLDTFLSEGGGTATAQQLIISCPLVLS